MENRVSGIYTVRNEGLFPVKPVRYRGEGRAQSQEEDFYAGFLQDSGSSRFPGNPAEAKCCPISVSSLNWRT